MPSSSIDIKVTPPIGTIVLNRPDCDNALSRTMIATLRQGIGDLHQEQRVRAVIITGAGKTFCSGRDLVEMAADLEVSSSATPQAAWGEQESECCDLIVDLLSFPKPLIAAINGDVIGFGVALALASDIVIASANAQLSSPETQQGLVAGVVAPLLAYRLGAGPASRILMTGAAFSAQEMFRVGLYQEIIEHELLWARGMEIGAQCATGAPQAIALTKRLLLETIGEKLFTDLASGAIASATARTTEAAQEGLQAFVEK